MIYGSCYLRLQSRGDRCVQPGSACGLIESQAGVQIHSPLLPMAETASRPFRCRSISFGWQTFWGPPLCLGQGFQSWLEGKNLIITSKKKETDLRYGMSNTAGPAAHCVFWGGPCTQCLIMSTPRVCSYGGIDALLKCSIRWYLAYFCVLNNKWNYVQMSCKL